MAFHATRPCCPAGFPRGGGLALAIDGVKIARCAFDANGLITTVRSEDETGALLPDRDGATGATYSYSAYGQKVEATTLGPDAGPLRNPAFPPIVRRWYDARGNEVRRTFLDHDGAAFAGSDGTAGFRAVFDARDREILRVGLGPDGRDLISAAAPRERRSFDAYDRQTRIDFEGPDGAPISHSSIGAASVLKRYDRAGRLVETTYLDVDGRATRNAEGHAVLRQTYDRYGRETAREFLGPDARPTAPATGGPAGWTTRYDQTGRVALIAYRDVAGSPARDPDTGAFAKRQRHDANGRLVEEIHLDAAGAPMLTAAGFAGARSEYDALGRQARVTYLGPDRAAIQPPRLAAQVTYGYDAYGREIERRFFDAAGRPAPSPASGRAIVRMRYDSYSRPVEEQSLGADGRPVTRRDEGWSRRTTAYDAAGTARNAWFDAAGAPVDAPR